MWNTGSTDLKQGFFFSLPLRAAVPADLTPLRMLRMSTQSGKPIPP